MVTKLNDKQTDNSKRDNLDNYQQPDTAIV